MVCVIRWWPRIWRLFDVRGWIEWWKRSPEKCDMPVEAHKMHEGARNTPSQSWQTAASVVPLVARDCVTWCCVISRCETAELNWLACSWSSLRDFKRSTYITHHHHRRAKDASICIYEWHARRHWWQQTRFGMADATASQRLPSSNSSLIWSKYVHRWILFIVEMKMHSIVILLYARHIQQTLAAFSEESAFSTFFFAASAWATTDFNRASSSGRASRVAILIRYECISKIQSQFSGIGQWPCGKNCGNTGDAAVLKLQLSTW